MFKKPLIQVSQSLRLMMETHTLMRCHIIGPSAGLSGSRKLLHQPLVRVFSMASKINSGPLSVFIS